MIYLPGLKIINSFLIQTHHFLKKFMPFLHQFDHIVFKQFFDYNFTCIKFKTLITHNFNICNTIKNPQCVLAFSGSVNSAAKVIIMKDGFTAASVFTVENTGDAPLRFYTAAKADNPVPETAPELQPGKEDEFTPAQLGAAGNTFLMVYNPDASLKGIYGGGEISI